LKQKQQQDITQKQKSEQRQYQAPKQLQDLAALLNQDLEQRMIQDMAQHPALVRDEEPDFPEDALREDPEGWNPDFAKPEDEWETGERMSGIPDEDQDLPDSALALERAAEEHCGNDLKCFGNALKAIHEFRLTGRLPDDADNWLADALASLERSYSEPEPPSPLPTFEVKVENGRVIAVVTANMADFIQVKRNIPGFKLGQKFLEQRRHRLLLLNGIGRHLLEDLQCDFFRQKDLKSALLALLPIPVTALARLGIPSPVKLDKSFVSRLGNLTVACPLGIFPLSLFWPGKAALVRLWVRAAQEAGCSGAKDVRAWIVERLSERGKTIIQSDKRTTFLKSLQTLEISDVRNALKALKRKPPYQKAISRL
jgi:hypothetical protein